MDEKKPEKIEDLQTLKEFAKDLDSKVSQLYVFSRFGKLNGRYSRDDAVNTFGSIRVFNFFQKEDTIYEVYLNIN